jgi:hypothetical protein
MTTIEMKKYDQILKAEISKRWPLVYKNKNKGVYICRFPDDTLSSFRLVEYGRYPIYLRLKDMTPWDHWYGNRDYFASRRDGPINRGTVLEFTFCEHEAEKAISWALDNYLELKEIPDWVCNLQSDHVGKPLFRYCYTMEQFGAARNKLRRCYDALP